MLLWDKCYLCNTLSMLRQATMKVLVVGTGITGAATAALLRKELQQNVQLVLWDKAGGAGGRMSTSRHGNNAACTVDLGAQYITLTPKYNAVPKRKSLYDELETAGVLAKFNGIIENDQYFVEGAQHYVTPNGVSSLVKYFLNKADAEVRYNQQVTRVDYSRGGGQVRVATQGGDSGDFDTVILTMPAPQVLQLQGQLASTLGEQQDVRSKLEKVSFSARFALGLFYEKGVTLDFPWSSLYVQGDPCIRYVAIDNKKRGKEDSDVVPSVVVHTSAPFALKNLEVDKEAMGPTIQEHLSQVLPDLPKPASVKSHKWRYSQVHRGYEGSPGFVVVEESPLIVLGGDSYSQSFFDCCIDSAESLMDQVLKFAAKRQASSSQSQM